MIGGNCEKKHTMRRINTIRKKGGSCGCEVMTGGNAYGPANKIALNPAIVGGRKPRSSAKRSYRKRVKKSVCRGLMTAKCRHHKTCKMALGKKRSFCRKKNNTKREPFFSTSSSSWYNSGKTLE